MSESSDELDALRAIARRTPGLDLLVLFGSRARRDAHGGSDWDLAFLGNIDSLALRLDLVRVLGTEGVDLVDLARAGALLRFRVARDGHALFEATPDAFDEFRIRAAILWCDLQPVLTAAYDDVLERLGP